MNDAAGGDAAWSGRHDGRRELMGSTSQELLAPDRQVLGSLSAGELRNVPGRMAAPPGLPSRAAPAGLLVLTLLAAALRLFRLDGQPVWMDEVASLANARAFGAGGLPALAGADHVAPLHSILLWYAVRASGANEIAMRMPSVVAGVLTVPAMYLVAWRMFRDARVALLSAALVTISPFAIWYAQEARMYALLLLCALLQVGLSWPVTVRPLRPAEWAGLTLVSATGFYTHHYLVLLSMAFGLFLLVRGGLRGIAPALLQPRFRGWAATQAIAFLLFTYWLWLTADKLHNHAGFAKPAPLLWVPYTLFSFVAGLSFGPSVEELRTGAGAVLRADGPRILVVAASSLVVLLAGVRAALRPGRRDAGLWTLLWLTVPIALAIGATLVTNIQFNVRYVIICYPALMLLLALGVTDMLAATSVPGPQRMLVAASAVAVAACMIVSLDAWYTDPRHGKEEVRPLAAMLSRRGPGTAIVADNVRIVPVLNFYGARLPAGTLAVDNILWGRTPAVVERMLEHREQAGPLPPIGLISYRSWETDTGHLTRQWLEAHERPVADRQWRGVSFRQYVPRATSGTR